MEDPEIILANIRRYQEMLERELSPDMRERAKRLLAEAEAEFARAKAPAGKHS